MEPAVRHRSILPKLALLAACCASGCSAPGGLTLPNAIGAGSAGVAMAPQANHRKLRFVVFTAGETPGFPAGAYAEDIARGQNGSMWFTDGGTAAIGRISAQGEVTEFTKGLPPGATPYVIVPGLNGTMWFSDYRGAVVGRISPSGDIVEYTAPQYSDSPATGVAAGKDGTAWFVTVGPNAILANVTTQGKVRVVRIPQGFRPDNTLAEDAGANLWFVARDSNSQAVVIERTPKGAFVKFPTHMYPKALPCCPHLAPKPLVIGPDGNPWFTMLTYGYKKSPEEFIGTVRGGSVHLVDISRKDLQAVSYPSSIAAGISGLWLGGSDPFWPDGSLWYTGPLSVSGQVAYGVKFSPIGIAVDAADNPWITAGFGGMPSQIVKIIAR
jgi:sugar lactone lactonase YvrE